MLAAYALNRELDDGLIKTGALVSRGDPTPGFLWIWFRQRRRLGAHDASAAKPVHCPRRAGARVSATLQTNERPAAATGDSGEPTGKATAWLTAAAA